MGMSADNLYLELQNDGKFKMTLTDGVHEGAYEINGNTITLDDEMEGTLTGNKIVIEEKGDADTEGFSSTKMVFEKK